MAESQTNTLTTAGTPLRRQALGLGLAALAALFASSAGVLLRHVETADAWTVLVYRSLGFVATVLVFIAVHHGRHTIRRFGQIGRPGLFVAVSLGGAFIAFVLALTLAHVATVVAVLGVSPMVAALIAWAVIGERPSNLAWLAMAAAFAGVSVVVWDGLRADSVFGMMCAVLACLGYAGAVVGLRAGSHADMSPAICLSGVVAGIVSLAVVDTLSASPNDMVIGLLLGSVQIGAQYILLTVATRFASAADVALVMILEIILAPVWVWLFVGEAAPVAVLYGGAVIVAALVLNGVALHRA